MIHPLIKPKKVKSAPTTVVFAPTENIKRLMTKAVNSGENFQARPPLSGQFSFTQRGKTGIVGPAVGSPAAVLALEPLLASGTSRVVVVGTCGGLCPTAPKNSASLFDLVFPRGTVSEEGTSSLYGSKENTSSGPSALQLELEAALLPLSESSKTGVIWTTDAPYRETWEKVQHYHSMGAVAVEMEYAAIAQICKIYDAELAAVFVVSDLLGKTWLNGMGQAKLKEKLSSICSLVLRLIDEDNKRGKTINKRQINSSQDKQEIGSAN